MTSKFGSMNGAATAANSGPKTYEELCDAPSSERQHELIREWQKSKRDKMFDDLMSNSEHMEAGERAALEAKLARMREMDLLAGSVRPTSPFK